MSKKKHVSKKWKLKLCFDMFLTQLFISFLAQTCLLQQWWGCYSNYFLSDITFFTSVYSKWRAQHIKTSSSEVYKHALWKVVRELMWNQEICLEKVRSTQEGKQRSKISVAEEQFLRPMKSLNLVWSRYWINSPEAFVDKNKIRVDYTIKWSDLINV